MTQEQLPKVYDTMKLSANWTPVRIAWTPDNAPSETAISNATRLLDAVKGTAPDWAGRGDWPTVCLHWSKAKVEIEVYDDMYQLCQFDPVDHATITVLDFETNAEGLSELIKAAGFTDQLQPG